MNLCLLRGEMSGGDKGGSASNSSVSSSASSALSGYSGGCSSSSSCFVSGWMIWKAWRPERDAPLAVEEYSGSVAVVSEERRDTENRFLCLGRDRKEGGGAAVAMMRGERV